MHTISNSGPKPLIFVLPSPTAKRSAEVVTSITTASRFYFLSKYLLRSFPRLFGFLGNSIPYLARQHVADR